VVSAHSTGIAIIRPFGHFDDNKADLYDGLFRIQSWLAVNYFLSWRASTPTDRSWDSFHKKLVKNVKISPNEALALSSRLTSSCFIYNDQAVGPRLDQNTRAYVLEYETAITRHVTDFWNALRAAIEWNDD
jgi:hypothetical protein